DRTGLDRFEFRQRNALEHRDMTSPGKLIEASAGLPDCLDALKNVWTDAMRRATAHNETDGAVRRGVGVACMWSGCGDVAPLGPARMKITLDQDGQLLFWNGAVDSGAGTPTILLQIAADALGLPVEAFD